MLLKSLPRPKLIGGEWRERGLGRRWGWPMCDHLKSLSSSLEQVCRLPEPRWLDNGYSEWAIISPGVSVSSPPPAPLASRAEPSPGPTGTHGVAFTPSCPWALALLFFFGRGGQGKAELLSVCLHLSIPPFSLHLWVFTFSPSIRAESVIRFYPVQRTWTICLLFPTAFFLLFALPHSPSLSFTPSLFHPMIFPSSSRCHSLLFSFSVPLPFLKGSANYFKTRLGSSSQIIPCIQHSALYLPVWLVECICFPTCIQIAQTLFFPILIGTQHLVWAMAWKIPSQLHCEKKWTHL